jgi:acyl-CoA synthetase (AMP-forming)/AMP-acid ligase II
VNGSERLDQLLWSRRIDGPSLTERAASAVRRWTRAELDAHVDDLAGRLRSAWTELHTTNRLVGIWTPGSAAQALHVWAALRAGLCPAVLTPPTPRMDPGFYERTARPTVRALGAAMVVSDLGIEVPGGPPIVAPVSFAHVVDGEPAPARIDDDIAMVQLSSGTTGVKKAVIVDHDAVAAQLAAYGAALGLRPDDTVVSWLPLYHDMGFVTSVLLAPAHGAHSVLLDPFEWVADPMRWCEAASEERATLSWQPNFALALLAARATPNRLDGLDLSALRHLVCCSEPVTYAAQRAFVERFAGVGFAPAALAGSYAMAEATFAITHGTGSATEHLDHDGPDATLVTRRPVVSVGRALPDVELDARDQDGSSVPDGVVGELAVRAPWLARGYLAAAAAAAERFRDGWFRTGDLGYRRGDQWYVLGRGDDVIVVAGHNVLPEDVEVAAAACPGVRPGRTVAFAVDDPRIESRRLVVLVEPDGSPTPVDVAAVGRAVFAAVGAAARIEVVQPGWILKSSSGKPARAACRAKWTEAHA